MNDEDRTLFDDFLEELRIKPITTYSVNKTAENAEFAENSFSFLVSAISPTP